MIQLPILTELAQRKLDLQWEELCDSHTFYLRVYDSQLVRAEIYMGHRKTDYEMTVTEHLLNKTISLAETRFQQRTEAYFLVWASANDPRSKTFVGRLSEIQASAISEIEQLWATRDSHVALFENACRSRLEKHLESLIPSWKSRARRLEIQHIECPHLSLASLAASSGDPALALKLEEHKKTIESAQDLLGRLKLATSVPRAISQTSEDPQPIAAHSESEHRDAILETGPDAGESHPASHRHDRQKDGPKEPSGGRAGADSSGKQPRAPSERATEPLNVPPKRNHGFQPDMVEHRRIANIVGKHDNNWPSGSKAWRREATLKIICVDLDQNEVDMPEDWLKGKTPSLNGTKLKNWTDAFTLGYKKLLLDHIGYRLKMVRRNPLAALAKT